MGLLDDKKQTISMATEERAVLVGLVTPEQNEARAKEYLDELAFLADTAGAVTVKKFVQKCQAPNSTTPARQPSPPGSTGTTTCTA